MGYIASRPCEVVVDAHNFVVSRQEALAQMGSEEASSPCDKNSFAQTKPPTTSILPLLLAVHRMRPRGCLYELDVLLSSI